MRCEQELCPNWSGDGNVCPCALFGLEPEREDDLRAEVGPRQQRDSL